ncbi:MAG: hypothetical protein ACP5T0_13285 [Verrucomicrobiia bacterium]
MILKPEIVAVLTNRSDVNSLIVMDELSLDINFPPEFESLFKQGKELTQYIEGYQNILTTKSEYTFCPVCSNGYLIPVVEGKLAGVFNDYWLVCNNCNAKFDKRINKARIVEVDSDPYDTFKNYGNKLVSLKEWNDIALSRIREYKTQCENSLSEIFSMVENHIVKQVSEGKIKLLLGNIDLFLLKEGEEPVFSTRAIIYEEVTRKITKRTTTGGERRRYGGLSFRIASGVYYHIGESAPSNPRESITESSTYKENVPAEAGDFLATNQRLIFKGEKSKGFTIQLEKVSAIDVDYVENNIMIVQEKMKPVILSLVTKFTFNNEYVNIPIQIDLDTVVALIKSHISR